MSMKAGTDAHSGVFLGNCANIHQVGNMCLPEDVVDDDLRTLVVVPSWCRALSIPFNPKVKSTVLIRMQRSYNNAAPVSLRISDLLFHEQWMLGWNLFFNKAR